MSAKSIRLAKANAKKRIDRGIARAHRIHLRNNVPSNAQEGDVSSGLSAMKYEKNSSGNTDDEQCTVTG